MSVFLRAPGGLVRKRKETKVDEYAKIPTLREPLIALSILSLELPEPTNGWLHYLTGRGVEVLIDDLGRRAISRADARQLFDEHRAGEVRRREVMGRSERQAQAKDREFRSRLWQGVPADMIPDGMTAAQYMMAGDPDLVPRRKSAVAEFLDGDEMVLHPIYEPAEGAS
jgi:hypothetical protein